MSSGDGRIQTGSGTRTPDGEIILSVRGLTLEFRSRRRKGGWKTRDTVQALRGVDLEVHGGECLALVGESGSGKTTLARSILRLVEPSGGEVLFQGKDVLRMDSRELLEFRRKAQIVFQDPFGSLNPRLRAGAMLEEVLWVHAKSLSRAEREERVTELLGLVGLHPTHAGRFPHEFSGGQRQRLGIARALAVAPDFLVLDEPVSALDLSVQAQILTLLRDLRERLSLTLLMVAHDLSVVRQVADRVAVMYLGRLVEEGPVETLFGNPRHPYTRGLMAAADSGAEFLSGEASWALLPGEPPSPLAPPAGCPFHPRCPHPGKDAKCMEETPKWEGSGTAGGVACWREMEGPAGP